MLLGHPFLKLIEFYWLEERVHPFWLFQDLVLLEKVILQFRVLFG
jgi:hypothetical protein